MTGSGACGAVSVGHYLIHVLMDFTVHGGPLRILTLVRPSVHPACLPYYWSVYLVPAFCPVFLPVFSCQLY
jgi:hypothetical protein